MKTITPSPNNKIDSKRIQHPIKSSTDEDEKIEADPFVANTSKNKSFT